jgi:hypothetical protein
MPANTSRPADGTLPEVRSSAIRHQDITEDEFIERFGPIRNPVNSMAGFDFGDGGCLFESAGPDLEFVRAQPMNQVWTVIDGDDGLEITDGMHVVNRLGYLVTDRPCPPDTMVTVSLDG